MEKFRKTMLVCMVAFVCMAIIATAQESPAAGGRAGIGAAPAGAGRGMMGMGGRGGASSPVIASDNRVTFRISAPQAASVTVRGDFGDAAQMTKDEQGVWSVTVGPLQPEVYSYTFNIDGVTVLDPSNFHLSRDTTMNQNLLIVPGEGSDLYIVKDVPHGTVSEVWYDSPTLKMRRRMVVYTPPGYETGNEKYPVLYVLHGGGGDEDQWLRMARVPQIFDNLIAAGKAKPMIVVMPNGNANQAAATEAAPAQAGVRRGDTGIPAPGAAGAAPNTRGARGAGTAGGGAAGGYSEESLSVIAEEYHKSVGAFIDKNYRVLPGSENRAITGLSMGGGHAFYTGMKNMDYYSWVGEFSTSMFGGLQSTGITYDLDTAIGGVFKDPNNINKKLKLLYISCGREDPRLNATKEMTEELRKRGIQVVYTDWPGAHVWKVWRCALADMAKRLFK
jgi:enterochelin esterase-like enzyme